MQLQVLCDAYDGFDGSEAEVVGDLGFVHDHIGESLYRDDLLCELLGSDEARAVQQDLSDEDRIRHHH